MMTSTYRDERRRQIRQLVEAQGRVAVTELSALFSVSEATIRRDLEQLEKLGWLERQHGGAIGVERSAPELPVVQRSSAQPSEKHRIGLAAAKLVQDGSTIFIGSGTTTFEFARQLHNFTNLTVITNALNVANELTNRSGITLIVIGGILRTSELSLIGHLTEQALRDLRADKVFFGIHAVNLRDGLTNDYLPEILTDRAILKIAAQVILLADHTKFGRVSTSWVAPLTEVDVIISDDQLAPDVVAELEALGIQVVLA